MRCATSQLNATQGIVMTIEEFATLCEENPDFKLKMRLAMTIMDENSDVMRALADGAVPTDAQSDKAAAMRAIAFRDD